MGLRFFPRTLTDTARRALDSKVPAFRDLAVVLSHGRESSVPMLIESGGGQDVRKVTDASRKPGLHHLCGVVDCNQSIVSVLAMKSL